MARFRHIWSPCFQSLLSKYISSTIRRMAFGRTTICTYVHRPSYRDTFQKWDDNQVHIERNSEYLKIYSTLINTNYVIYNKFKKTNYYVSEIEAEHLGKLHNLQTIEFTDFLHNFFSVKSACANETLVNTMDRCCDCINMFAKNEDFFP
jgi:hypothetical protein